MQITSHRFGSLEIPDHKVIIMERPILGFEHLTEFCLIEREELAPLLWLQSLEDAMIAFPVVNPVLFYPDYRIEVNPNEIAELRVTRPESIETYVIMTLSDKPDQVSVNLQGPVLINTENNLAKQLVLVNSEYHVRHLPLEDDKASERHVTRREHLVGV